MSKFPASAEPDLPGIMVLGKPDEATKAYLQSLGTGVRFVTHERQLSQANFDFIMCFPGHEAALKLDGHATVLHFENHVQADSYYEVAVLKQVVIDGPWGDVIEYAYTVGRMPGTNAVRFDLVENPDTDTDYKSIASDTLYDTLQQGGGHTAIDVSDNDEVYNGWHRLLPLLSERDGHLIAGVITFADCAPFWSLPAQTADQLRWVKFFLDVQKRERTKDFPADQVGLTDDYRTPEELATRRAIKEHKAETTRLELQRKRMLQTLDEELERRQQEADAGDRRLIWGTGNDLTDRVASVLRGFGFDVEDRDVHAEQHQVNAMEDLRVTYPGAPMDGDTGRPWVALAEVKGYTRGAKANDLNKIGKYVRNYVRENGAYPSKQWYVVNALLKQAPHLRQQPLASSPESLEMFAGSGGLLLDTRNLFRLKRQVDAGEITKEQAAHQLMSQTGRFELPDGGPAEG